MLGGAKQETTEDSAAIQTKKVEILKGCYLNMAGTILSEPTSL
jgi:hypothetical protein